MSKLFWSVILGGILLIAGCSLFGEPANTSPIAALSKANLVAACASKTDTQLQVWAACTTESQVIAVCKNVRSGAPVDTQLVGIINAFVGSTDPVLSQIGSLSVSAANQALGAWCTQQGY